MKKILLTTLALTSTTFASSEFPNEAGNQRILAQTARYSTNPIPTVEREVLFSVTNSTASVVELLVQIDIQDRYGKCPKSFMTTLQPRAVFSKVRRDLGDEFNSARSIAEGVRINEIQVFRLSEGEAAILISTIREGGTVNIGG